MYWSGFCRETKPTRCKIKRLLIRNWLMQLWRPPNPEVCSQQTQQTQQTWILLQGVQVRTMSVNQQRRLRVGGQGSRRMQGPGILGKRIQEEGSHQRQICRRVRKRRSETWSLDSATGWMYQLTPGCEGKHRGSGLGRPRFRSLFCLTLGVAAAWVRREADAGAGRDARASYWRRGL